MLHGAWEPPLEGLPSELSASLFAPTVNDLEHFLEHSSAQLSTGRAYTPPHTAQPLSSKPIAASSQAPPAEPHIVIVEILCKPIQYQLPSHRSQEHYHEKLDQSPDHAP